MDTDTADVRTDRQTDLLHVWNTNRVNFLLSGAKREGDRMSLPACLPAASHFYFNCDIFFPRSLSSFLLVGVEESLLLAGWPLYLQMWPPNEIQFALFTAEGEENTKIMIARTIRVCLSVCLYVCMSVGMAVCLSIYIPVKREREYLVGEQTIPL